ncbi:MAG: ParB/RepB/Spo0J family partition protein [Elusimicrobiota bacterium]|nr:ParB/RepB/Spo0J family partition protein [Elusimicrobiota bacterium]
MQKGLGRGLEALIPIAESISVTERELKEEAILTIPIEKIKPNRYQPRIKFNQEKLTQLAESIKEKGIVQPLIVSESIVPDEYELIAGERRYRAAELAGLKSVPCVIRKVSDKERLQISLIENLQREDLNPVEVAKAYKQVLEEFQITQEELSKLIGIDRSVIANTVRLLNLPEDIQELVASGVISSGHARSIVSISDEKQQRELVDRIQREKLTVREVEELVHSWKQAIAKKKVSVRKRPAEIVSLENNLQKLLGTKVKIFLRGKKGKLVIFFYSVDYLDRLIETLKFFKI